MKRILSVSAICLLIDQIIKLIITTSFKLHEGITIIPNLLKIMRVHNTGAAWSILSGNTLFLILLSIIALITIYIIFIRNNKLTRIDKYVYGILIGGILGNTLDRIFRGYVIDYLDFVIFSYNFPVFNFADICIVLSIIIVLILQLGGKENEHNKDK